MARLVDIIATAWFAIALVTVINQVWILLDLPLTALHTLTFALGCVGVGIALMSAGGLLRRRRRAVLLDGAHSSPSDDARIINT